MLVEVKFIKKSQYADKGETRQVTEAAAAMFSKMGLIEKGEVKEEKAAPETKEEKEVFETKEKAPKAKVTKAPKL